MLGLWALWFGVGLVGLGFDGFVTLAVHKLNRFRAICSDGGQHAED